MLKALLLQTPSVWADGKPAALPFKRADALLYYMLVRKSASRQELISLIWEDCDEATGLKNLRNALYSLKKALGGDYLLSPQKSMIVLNESLGTDCDYDRLVRSKDISVYRGEFLQGFVLKRAFAFDEWVRSMREKTKEIYLGELLTRAEEAESTDLKEAARLSRDYLREDPFHEGAACVLMRSLSGLGEYEKAAQTYQALKKLLEEELGILPQQGTTALYYRIMNQWNELSGKMPEEAKTILPESRERIRKILCTALSGLSGPDGRTAAFLLTGEAGSGKSEVLRSFLGETDLGDFYVARTDCLQSEERFSIFPWKRLVRQLWETAGEEGLALPIRAQRGLEEAFLADGTAEEGIYSGKQTFSGESLIVFLRELSRKRKVLLVLENVQWMDPESGSLLMDVLTCHETGIMVVLSCRDDFAFSSRAMLRRLEQKGFLLQLKLSPLSADETGALLLRELGENEAEALTEAFHKASGGNLTLLFELIRKQKHGSGETDKDPASTLGPDLMGLPEHVRRTARVLSLFPEQISGGMLLSLIGGDDRLLTSGLEALRKKGLIEEDHGGREDYYRFRYSRIRELVSETVSPKERKAVYGAAAEFLWREGKTGSGREVRKIARYYELARMTEKMLFFRAKALSMECARAFVPFSWYGGEESLTVDRARVREEIRTLSLSLRKAKEKGMDRETADMAECLLLEAAGTEAVTGGDMEQGNALLGRISGMDVPDRKEQDLRVCYLLAQAAVFRQNPEAAERYVSAGMRILDGNGEKDGYGTGDGHGIGDGTGTFVERAAFQRLRGCCFCLRKAYEKAAYYFLDAIDALEKLPETPEARLQLAAAYADLARLSRHKNGFAEASAYFKKAFSLTEDSFPGLTWSYVHYGRTVFALEDHRKARELFRTAERISGENGELFGRAAALSYLFYYAAEDGREAEAAALLNEAEETASRMDSPLEKGILCFVSMAVKRRLELNPGDSGPLSERLREPAEQYARNGLRYFNGIPDVFEAEEISRALREGLSGKTSFRASELYGKARHFMTE